MRAAISDRLTSGSGSIRSTRAPAFFTSSIAEQIADSTGLDFRVKSRMMRPFWNEMVASSHPASKKRSAKSSASRIEAGSDDAKLKLLHRFLPTFLVGTAVHAASQVLCMVLRVLRRRPDKDLASVPVVMSAVELSPSMSLDLEPRPALLFSVGNRSLDLLVGMTGPFSHRGTEYLALC